MSDQDFFRLIPTKLDLNGPILGFSTNPVGVGTTDGGSVTLTGIATAEFPNAANNDGTISYRWYREGVGALSDGTNISGSGTTTVTLSNLKTPDDNGAEFFLRADYVPAQRTTGNAVNEPLDSDSAIVTVDPLIRITTQPTNRQSLINTDTNFSVISNLSDSTNENPLTFQWSLQGNDIDDGTITTEVPSTQVDITYTSDETVSLPSDATNVQITVAGGKGKIGGTLPGGGGGISAPGGSGRAGKFSYPDGARTLFMRVGNRGNAGVVGNENGGGSGGSSSVATGGKGGGGGTVGLAGGGGGGGGASGVFDPDAGGYTIIAGGGGGAGGAMDQAGGQSGGTGGFFSAYSNSDVISTDILDGDDGQSAPAASDGSGGGGGGGGYGRDSRNGEGGTHGIDGGVGVGRDSGGGNGGGSIHASDTATLLNEWVNDGDGYINLRFNTNTSIPGVTVAKTITNVVSGTKSDTLTIRSDSVGIQTIGVTISHLDATNSPLTSDTVNFAAVSNVDQFNVNVEAIGITSTASLSSINLFNGDYTFFTTGSEAAQSTIVNFYSIYSPDKDINVEMDLYGGKGYDVDAYQGGQGGYSRIRFTMEQNVEYVITGLSTSVNAPFVYRKAQLIAAVGGGGDAGATAGGGRGGGVGIAGEEGRGRSAGVGGDAFEAGTLPSTGIFGSRTTLTATSPDTKSSAPSAGRTLPCSRGVYWRSEGFTACEDVTAGQARISDGTVVTNTGSITRGYKDGYNIIQTDGRGDSGGGDGGAGATGGNGGSSNSGGGGGSGYTDGSVTVVDADLGGSDGNARVVLRVVT
jgi:hypothetical protein